MIKYKKLIEAIEIFLKEFDFTKSGQSFYFKKESNIGIINFQKSKNSSSSTISFTINVGISSSILRQFNGENISKLPDVEDSHWMNRIGFLLPEKQDHWWEVNDATNLEELKQEIIDIIKNVALPEMFKHITDDDLISHWLSGRSDGLTDLQRCENLVTLVKYKRSADLPSLIDSIRLELKGKSYLSAFNIHVSELQG
jgi:Domain of unknown function (DUF4304)